jgi:3'(2'), 5'-bisphosphate nucleotidase
MTHQINPKQIADIATAAGTDILGFYGRAGPIDKKADDSPLTQADRAAHERILTGLTEFDSGIPVLSEESDSEVFQARRSWSRFWLVDPLDGTKDFIKQTDCFTVNIALIEDGAPVFGLIHVPAKSLTYWAAQGEGAWRSDPLSAPRSDPRSDPRSQTPSRLEVAAPDLRAPRIVASRDHAGPDVKRLLERFPGHTCLSIGSSLKFCMVAEGEADIYLRDVPTFEWDVGAAQCIVTEAGGTVYDLRTRAPLRYNKDDLRNGSLLTLGASAIEDWGAAAPSESAFGTD